MSGPEKDSLLDPPAESDAPKDKSQPAAAGNAPAEFTAQMLSGPEWQPENSAAASALPGDAPGGPVAPAAGPDDNASPFTDAHRDALPEEAAGGPPEPPSPPGSSAASESSAPVPAPPSEPPAPGEGQTPAAPREQEPEPMSLMEHLGELRMRLVRCCIAVGLGFLACWVVVDPIFNALVNPLIAVLPPGSHAQYTTLPEGFFTRMYIAFIAGVFVSSPVIFYQVWSFIAPGLYENEKRLIIPIAVVSAFFFICGGAFCYFVVFPYAFSFFVSFSTSSIVVIPKISDYLDFVLKLILAFGLIFEMPLFAFFLARMGLVNAAMMRKARRYAILAIFVVAAILTPPDVVSQLLMACPMILLYELSIGVAALFGRKKRPPEPDKKKNDDATGAEEA